MPNNNYYKKPGLFYNILNNIKIEDKYPFERKTKIHSFIKNNKKYYPVSFFPFLGLKTQLHTKLHEDQTQIISKISPSLNSLLDNELIDIEVKKKHDLYKFNISEAEELNKPVNIGISNNTGWVKDWITNKNTQQKIKIEENVLYTMINNTNINSEYIKVNAQHIYNILVDIDKYYYISEETIDEDDILRDDIMELIIPKPKKELNDNSSEEVKQQWKKYNKLNAYLVKKRYVDKL